MIPVYIIIGLSFFSGVAYAIKGDAPRAIYWLSAAIIGTSTLFIK